MSEIHWGLPVIGYLFLAGTGAGAMTVSASVLLRGGGGFFGGHYFKIARYGALIAPLPLIIGTALILLELGSFQVGIRDFDFAMMFRWINLFNTINMSPMSIGSWILMFGIVLSLIYAWTYLLPEAKANDSMSRIRTVLAWIGVPVGIGVALYTGILLGAMPARPFWNSQILGLLFTLSALSTGVAGILLLYAIDRKEEGDDKNTEYFKSTHDSGYILSASDALLIGSELLVIFLFIMFAHLTVGDPAHAIEVILPGGSLSSLFWIGVVLFGLAVPGLVELHHILPRLLHHKPYLVKRWVEISIAILVLLGAFLLRYVIVIAGQVTGPVGM